METRPVVKDSASQNGIEAGSRWSWQRLCLLACMLLGFCASSRDGLAQPFCPHPIILNPPASSIVLAGSNAVFNVGMQDYSCVFGYTWRYFDVNIFVGTNGALTIYNVHPPPATGVGYFSVVVTNVSGSVTSSIAYLTVVDGPLPANPSVAAGGSITLSNQVYAYPGSGTPRYQWRLNTQNLAGETNATLTLSDVHLSQAGAYSVMVSNPAGSVVTWSTRLTVTPGSPRLWGLMVNAEGARFWVSGAASATYRIQAADSWGDWKDLGTAYIAPTNGDFEVYDPQATGVNWRCYRALQQ